MLPLHVHKLLRSSSIDSSITASFILLLFSWCQFYAHFDVYYAVDFGTRGSADVYKYYPRFISKLLINFNYYRIFYDIARNSCTLYNDNNILLTYSIQFTYRLVNVMESAYNRRLLQLTPCAAIERFIINLLDITNNL